jgi:hypothetical protein
MIALVVEVHYVLDGMGDVACECRLLVILSLL